MPIRQISISFIFIKQCRWPLWSIFFQDYFSMQINILVVIPNPILRAIDLNVTSEILTPNTNDGATGLGLENFKKILYFVKNLGHDKPLDWFLNLYKVKIINKRKMRKMTKKNVSILKNVYQKKVCGSLNHPCFLRTLGQRPNCNPP